jgi:hypothetical protein
MNFQSHNQRCNLTRHYSGLPSAAAELQQFRPQKTLFEASAHMLDIVATAIARCKLQVLSIFLTYLLSSGVGILMVHSGSLLAFEP